MRPILNIWFQFTAQSPFHNLFISGSAAHIIIKSENKMKANKQKNKFNPLSDVRIYPSQPDALSMRMTDIYVLIVAAFYSADYFASRTRYCLDAEQCKQLSNVSM